MCLDNTTLPARLVTRNCLRPCHCGLIPVYCWSVSFSYLRSAAGVSFDIKKACRKPYTPPIGGGQLSNSVLCLAVSWGPDLSVVPSLSWEPDFRPPGALRPPLLPPQSPAHLPAVLSRLPAAFPPSWVSRASCGPRVGLPLSRATPPSPWQSPFSAPWLPPFPLSA